MRFYCFTPAVNRTGGSMEDAFVKITIFSRNISSCIQQNVGSLVGLKSETVLTSCTSVGSGYLVSCTAPLHPRPHPQWPLSLWWVPRPLTGWTAASGGGNTSGMNGTSLMRLMWTPGSDWSVSESRSYQLQTPVFKKEELRRSKEAAVRLKAKTEGILQREADEAKDSETYVGSVSSQRCDQARF